VSDFQYVSLGFAEFVGQLLTETFEATINAQQYQLRRYAELQAAIDLPDEQFLLQFIDPQLVLTRETLIAGSPIARQMIVPPERQAFILELTEEFEEESVIFKNRLTNYGFEASWWLSKKPACRRCLIVWNRRGWWSTVVKLMPSWSSAICIKPRPMQPKQQRVMMVKQQSAALSVWRHPMQCLIRRWSTAR